MTAARHASIAIIGALFFVFGVASWLLAMTATLIKGIVDGALVTRLFAMLKKRDDVQWVFLLSMVPRCLHTLYFALRRHCAGMRPRHQSRMMPVHLAD
jgi:hypothetical protein